MENNFLTSCLSLDDDVLYNINYYLKNYLLENIFIFNFRNDILTLFNNCKLLDIIFEKIKINIKNKYLIIYDNEIYFLENLNISKQNIKTINSIKYFLYYFKNCKKLKHNINNYIFI